MKIQSYFFTLIVCSGCCSIWAADALERKTKIEALEAVKPSTEALERRDKSNKRLQEEGVLISKSLPVISDSKGARVRTAEAIAKRIMALGVVSIKGQTGDSAEGDAALKQFNAEAFLTPKEAAFLKNRKPTDLALVAFSWRYEALWTLLWSIGYIEKLDPPKRECDVDKILNLFKTHDMARLIKEAKLRPIADILDEADLIYRYHWATEEVRVNNKSMISQINAEIIMERHHALNWLIGYMDEEWDDVSTDT